MKKFVALMLVLLTLAFAGVAVADDLTAAIEASFDGVWVQYEDGFEIYLPSDWLDHEVTDDLLDAGIFSMYSSADEANFVMLAWQPLDAEIAIEDLCTALAADYADAELLNVSGIDLVSYTDTDNDTAVLVALDGAEPGIYLFMFTPASDEAFIDTYAGAIAASIRNIE